MALSKKHQEILNRAHLDPKFRLSLLKELLRLAVARDPELLDKALEKVESK
jgi:hypothetical protein